MNVKIYPPKNRQNFEEELLKILSKKPPKTSDKRLEL